MEPSDDSQSLTELVGDASEEAVRDTLANEDTLDSNPLRDRIANVLTDNRDLRQLDAGTNAAWQIMHGVLPYGRDLTMLVNGQSVGAVAYLLGADRVEGSVEGWKLLPGTQLANGRLGMTAELNPGSYIGQGHVDQWLAILSQTDLPLDYPVHVGEEIFTVEDWARQAQQDISRNPVREYSWTLIALMNYFPNDVQWTCEDGNTWGYESLVKFEAEQDLVISACGGTHRLMALAHAVRFQRQNNLPNLGGWKLAEDRLAEVIEQARQWQNSDGTLSCNYTQRPGRSAEIGQSISTTGHMFEVIAFSLTESELDAPWVVASAISLCEMLEATRTVDLDCGALYHSLNGLKIYQQRRWPNSNAL
jgi:hypothetical protein